MHITEEKILRFARIFGITTARDRITKKEEKLAEDCISILGFMPTIDKGLFNARITGLYNDIKDEEKQLLALIKDALDNRLGMEEGRRANAFSNRQKLFWDTILQPSPEMQSLLEKFVQVIGRENE